MAEYYIHVKRAGKHRNFPRWVRASSIKAVEAPLREELEGIVPNAEQMTITIDETPDEEGVYKGQFDYGLTGEFTIQKA